MANLKAGATINGFTILHAGHFDAANCTDLKGAKGDDGAQGTTGDTGEKGDQGPGGAQGAAGATGNPGTDGDKGDKGAPGAGGDAGAAGTTFRFMTAYLSTKEGSQVLTGTERMKQRPIGVLAEALKKLGAKILGDDGVELIIEFTGSPLEIIKIEKIIKSLKIIEKTRSGLVSMATGVEYIKK